MSSYILILIDFLSRWGYLAVVLGMALESACMPVPSEIVLPFAGYLVYQEQLTYVEAVSAGILGGMLGSVASYGVGRWGGRPLILKYGRYLLINARNLDKADRWVARHGDRAAFWARFFPVVRTFISLPLGMTKMPFGRFFLYSLAGSLPWTMILVLAGRELGENWDRVAHYGDPITYFIIVLLILALIYGVLQLRRQSPS